MYREALRSRADDVELEATKLAFIKDARMTDWRRTERNRRWNVLLAPACMVAAPEEADSSWRNSPSSAPDRSSAPP
jgi:hypothetical protein